jgi:hypothetical protein
LAAKHIALITKTKDSVMEHGPLVAVLSLMLTALGVGKAIGLALQRNVGWRLPGSPVR